MPAFAAFSRSSWSSRSCSSLVRRFGGVAAGDGVAAFASTFGAGGAAGATFGGIGTSMRSSVPPVLPVINSPPLSRTTWAKMPPCFPAGLVLSVVIGNASSFVSFVSSSSVVVTFAGSVPSSDGFWLPPTVVLPTSTAAPVWREEIFGPVAAVMPFDDEDEAIALANDTEFGLSGSIFTRDVGRALRVARGVESGNLSVNSHSSVRYWTPFGGYKQSGLGRELGPDAPQAFTEEKNVFIAQD